MLTIDNCLAFGCIAANNAIFLSQVYHVYFFSHFCSFMVVWGSGFWGWGLGLGFWGWGFQLMGFRACGVGPTGVFGVGVLHNIKNEPGEKPFPTVLHSVSEFFDMS